MGYINEDDEAIIPRYTSENDLKRMENIILTMEADSEFYYDGVLCVKKGRRHYTCIPCPFNRKDHYGLSTCIIPSRNGNICCCKIKEKDVT